MPTSSSSKVRLLPFIITDLAAQAAVSKVKEEDTQKYIQDEAARQRELIENAALSLKIDKNGMFPLRMYLNELKYNPRFHN